MASGAGKTPGIYTAAYHASKAAVISLTRTAAAALGLLPESTELGAWLGKVEATPFVTVAVVTDRPIRSDWFGLGFPRTEVPGDRIVVACSEASKAGRPKSRPDKPESSPRMGEGAWRCGVRLGGSGRLGAPPRVGRRGGARDARRGGSRLDG